MSMFRITRSSEVLHFQLVNSVTQLYHQRPLLVLSFCCNTFSVLDSLIVGFHLTCKMAVIVFDIICWRQCLKIERGIVFPLCISLSVRKTTKALKQISPLLPLDSVVSFPCLNQSCQRSDTAVIGLEEPIMVHPRGLERGPISTKHIVTIT